ncbi:MAG: Vitamin B12 dependent methionine synthase activation subunit [Firmicutes bacterium]|nr:Vitamin B12 dependent methionine synthase activation subunit [Bacillota bacterium]
MSEAKREALRYLGVRGRADPAIAALVDECFGLLAAQPPRHVVRVVPAGEALALGESRSLAKYLAGCEEAALLAATLGSHADQLIRRFAVTDTLRAAALHACAAARIEAYCDAVQAEVPGALRPRFSPGYGDFPLAGQRKLLALLDAGRRLGLYLTDGDMLAPSKSITAVMGIGPAAAGCKRGKCAGCDKADCVFKEEARP